MNILAITLTVLSLSATRLASIARSSDKIASGDKWTQSDMETWEEFGRWRRAHPRHEQPDSRRDGRDYDNDRDDSRRGRRWNDDRDRRGREYPDRHDNDRKDKPYPPNVIPPSRQPPSAAIPEPAEPEQPPVFNPLPIIIEPIPIRPMPSIIEPYPLIESTASIVIGDYPPVSSKTGESGTYYSQTADYSVSASSSVYYPSSTPVDEYTTKSAVIVSKKYTPTLIHNNNNYTSTTISYGSTSIVTVPESTVTTKVTGRYRAMSNSATDNVAGSISFGLVLFGSLFLLILV